MAGHAQLKFVMTECSKTQIRLTGLNSYLHILQIYKSTDTFLVHILSECFFATPDCFLMYLINAESMESHSVCTEMGFISEQLCILMLTLYAEE